MEKILPGGFELVPFRKFLPMTYSRRLNVRLLSKSGTARKFFPLSPLNILKGLKSQDKIPSPPVLHIATLPCNLHKSQNIFFLRGKGTVWSGGYNSMKSPKEEFHRQFHARAR
jgi:hypothetical protein